MVALLSMPKATFIVSPTIDPHIHTLRGQRVMLDANLATLYGVPTGALNRAVKRNLERFPADFMFQLTLEEFENLKCQIGISSCGEDLEHKEVANLKYQIGTSSSFMADDKGLTNPTKVPKLSESVHGGRRRSLPTCFTQEGVAMLSSVLHSSRAIAVNIEIMRAFVRLRQLTLSVRELAAKVEALEQNYDGQFGVVFDAIRELMTPPAEESGTIGFLGTPKQRKTS